MLVKTETESNPTPQSNGCRNKKDVDGGAETMLLVDNENMEWDGNA